MADPPRIDPYARCSRECVHDLARGVLVNELIEKDGPYPETASLDFGAAFVLAALRVREAGGGLVGV